MVLNGVKDKRQQVQSGRTTDRTASAVFICGTIGHRCAATIFCRISGRMPAVYKITVLRHHAVIHTALGDAVRKELLVSNPTDLAWRPSKEAFITTPYSADEIHQLFKAIKGHELEVLLKLTAFYGLRRSEVLGLKWKVCNFEQNTVSINHTIHRIHDNGNTVNVARDKVKRKSSYRTLPMSEPIVEMLLLYRHQRYADGAPAPDAYLFLE